MKNHREPNGIVAEASPEVAWSRRFRVVCRDGVYSVDSQGWDPLDRYSETTPPHPAHILELHLTDTEEVAMIAACASHYCRGMHAAGVFLADADEAIWSDAVDDLTEEWGPHRLRERPEGRVPVRTDYGFARDENGAIVYREHEGVVGVQTYVERLRRLGACPEGLHDCYKRCEPLVEQCAPTWGGKGSGELLVALAELTEEIHAAVRDALKTSFPVDSDGRMLEIDEAAGTIRRGARRITMKPNTLAFRLIAYLDHNGRSAHSVLAEALWRDDSVSAKTIWQRAEAARKELRRLGVTIVAPENEWLELQEGSPA